MFGSHRSTLYAANPVAASSVAVAFDGAGDYYNSTGMTTSATDGKFATIACTLYWGGGNNLQQIIALRLGTGTSDWGFHIWINGGRTQVKLKTGDGSNENGFYEDAENSLATNAWSQMVMYIDRNNFANCRIYINGVNKAISNESLNNNNFNWGATSAEIRIGQQITAFDGRPADFNGRIAQLYVHNASGAPTISNYWDSGAGKPKDLGTQGSSTGLARPLIYHYGDTSTFPTNNGTGFNSYTLTANGGVANTTGPTYA